MTRSPANPVEPIFIERWSRRAFSPSKVSPEHIASLFEAARWSPSCFNAQPWTFVYGATPEDHARVLSFLAEGNQVWAQHAPVLGVVFARSAFEHNGKPNRWAEFDSGAASMALALQAASMGLSAHFMGGFDAEAAHTVLGVPSGEFTAIAAFAIGHPGDPSDLPENLREREAPSDRKSAESFAFEGRFSRD